jgi:hypothetical protein
MRATAISAVRGTAQYAIPRCIRGGLLAIALVIVCCSTRTVAQNTQSPAEPVFAGDTFAAESRSERFLVVIIGSGEVETASRPARAFLCNDQDIGQLFVGEVIDDQLTLLPEVSVRQRRNRPLVVGTLSAGQVTGEVIYEGQMVMFVAAPTAGPGGYWEGVRPPGGMVLGASSTGAHVLGQAPMAPTETEEGPRYRIDGIVTFPRPYAVAPDRMTRSQRQPSSARSS